MTNGDDYRQQAEEAAARVDWCEKKLTFERKRHRALRDLVASDDWLEGRICPIPKKEGSTDAR